MGVFVILYIPWKQEIKDSIGVKECGRYGYSKPTAADVLLFYDEGEDGWE